MAEDHLPVPLLHQVLSRHTGYLLSRMGTIAQRQFAAKIGEVGLNPRMWGALNVLNHEGSISQQQLGRSVGIDPSSMVATIDELEAQGLAERRRHPTDRRAHALHITPLGEETLAQGRKLAASAQEELLAPLDDSERELLHALLLRLAIAAG
jgi:DNA-binding MarR family transcriptional regulator